MVIPARLIAERRVAGHFLDHVAVSPDTAIAYDPERWSRARALARLRDLGVVKLSDSGLYLDEIAWDARTGKRRKRALALLALGAVSAGIAGLVSFRP